MDERINVLVQKEIERTLARLENRRNVKMGKLAGKVAVVTGGARGIGEAITRCFVNEGAKVFIVDVLVKEGEAVAKSIGKDAKFMKHDVSVPAEWPKIISEAEQSFGLINILVNNAGILNSVSFMDISDEMFLKVLLTNAYSQFLGIKAAVPSMRKTGKGGSIINLSSMGGLKGGAVCADYNASKWAVRGISRSAALAFGEEKIRSNTIHPGPVNTPMVSSVQDMLQYASTLTALKTYAEPEEIANLALYLASEDSKFCTGAEFVIDGGMTA